MSSEDVRGAARLEIIELLELIAAEPESPALRAQAEALLSTSRYTRARVSPGAATQPEPAEGAVDEGSGK